MKRKKERIKVEEQEDSRKKKNRSNGRKPESFKANFCKKGKHTEPELVKGERTANSIQRKTIENWEIAVNLGEEDELRRRILEREREKEERFGNEGKPDVGGVPVNQPAG